MKKILIISNSYPNYGGQSTTAYNLLKLLQSSPDIKARLIYINYHPEADADPEKTGKSDKIALKQNLPYKIYQWYKAKFSGNRKPFYKTILFLKDLYFSSQLLPRIFYQMIRKRYYPDLVITNIPVYYTLLKRVFNPKKMLVLVGSSSEMYELSRSGIDAQTVLANNTEALDKLKKYNSINYEKTNLIFNSRLTEAIYSALRINTDSSYVQYFNFVPTSTRKTQSFAGRTNDIAFIASIYSRNIKNAALAYTIFDNFPTARKLAIGTENENFANIPGTTIIGQQTQTEIVECLGNTKLLIITSYFDSSPSVLSEAILNGCNVLVSKNVGWHEMLDERCVVQNYADINEWKTKAAYLLENEIDYTAFKNTIANSTQNIMTTIESVMQKA